MTVPNARFSVESVLAETPNRIGTRSVEFADEARNQSLRLFEVCHCSGEGLLGNQPARYGSPLVSSDPAQRVTASTAQVARPRLAPAAALASSAALSEAPNGTVSRGV